MDKAADRLLAGVRDDVVRTSAGPVAVTVTIGGVTAPRHARTVHEILARAQETLERRQGEAAAARSWPISPNVEREALRRENVRATDEIVAALNERRILLAFEPVVETRYARARVLRMPDAHSPRRRHARPRRRSIPIAERLGLVRLLDHRVLELVVSELAAVPASARQPQRLARLDHRSGLVVGARRAAARQPGRRRAADRRDHRDGRDPRHRRHPRLRRPREGPRLPHRDRRFRRRLSPRSATCASSASTCSRSTAPSCRTSRARRTTAPSCGP